MSLYLGLDTSNYRTSAAVFDDETGTCVNEGRLLEVPEGQLGLRQSEALFQHIVHLPQVLDRLGISLGRPIAAVGVSTRPRNVEGSYMPCFLAGKTVGESIAKVQGVPCIWLSHQQGHIVSAAFSAGRLDLMGSSFYAWHLSGGTTELLRVSGDADCLIRAEIIGGTTDIAAGQLIDRAGVLLSMSFPAGAQLETEARFDAEYGYRPKVRECRFSLSGMENKITALYQNGAARDIVAAAAIQTVCNAVMAATKQALDKEKLPVLFCGGVSANGYLRTQMSRAYPGQCCFASKALSGDNAAGAAVFAYLKSQGAM